MMRLVYTVSIAGLVWSLTNATAHAAPAAAASAPAKYRFNLPPSVQLHYAIKARQSGISVDGNAKVQWKLEGDRFVITNQAHAMIAGKILDAKTEGLIDEYGLAPVDFTEKRFRKEPTTTSFDRAARTIRFSASEQTHPLQGGEQDRNSAIWQLVAIARAASAKLKPGTRWTFLVAGQRNAEPWTFQIIRQEKIRTPLGDMNTLHIAKLPPPDAKEQQIDIWLAPRNDWYPVRVRFSDDNGDFIEQTLAEIHK